ncbi:MAG: ABC transporter ATP-binding protein/permease [candidate division KSB1 bacterium]|nr:ABC transporter ATP-binding protein/permease [candidate division KSB1 bacterium]MDZ7275916.1 ABC transporter ATP-binding protein/permease [candidate division KSB1 bacterium]MDZ7285802.1 ABC transporter ATP-binding protein/permease [candidate division KSB1 bacterium]MDZ7298834.1 ABC transporter ATP-binding protein/permease [candidate division KSB1 bacterium]MDZ7308865.1 ABC transporter ATP-binding protein/permease [candidate division KSB1 bacterium]
MTQNLLQKYFHQPDALPAAVSKLAGQYLAGEKVQAYAMCDLDRHMRFTERWLILGEIHLATVEPDGEWRNGSTEWRVSKLPLADVEKWEWLEGLSSSRLNLIHRDGRLLVSLQFTRRQSRAMSNLQFLAEQTRERLRAAATPAESVAEIDGAEEYRDAMLQAVREAKATLAVPRMGVMMRLLSYLRPHWRNVALGLTLATLLTGLNLLPPYLTGALIDRIIRPAESGAIADPWFWLWVVIGALAFVWAGGEFLSYLRLRLMALTGEKIAAQLRGQIYAHMQKLSLAFFSARSTGSLITRVSSDTDRLWDFITFGIIEIVVAVLQIIGVAMALLLMDWSLALLVLIPLPLMTWLLYRHSQRIQILFLRIWRKWSAMTGVLSDVIPGIRVVKAFAQERHEIHRFEEKNRALEREADNLHETWTRFWPKMVMLMHTCSLIVWSVGAPRVLRHVLSHGAAGMPLGVFIAFTGYMWMFWEPVRHLGIMSRTLNRATSSASRVFEVLDTTPTIISKPDAIRREPLDGRVTFENVTFNYDGIRNVLQGVSFEVQPGEMIGLAGPSGSGKSTLVNLICRFYDVKSGAVKIDGIDVRDLELSSLRRQIGMVLQEPYLFRGSIAENIAYGSQNASLHDIINAARIANAHEFICGLPDGYDTMIGERGLTLSGGERQRISIARAILHNPRILILDEATSSVDTETEKKIQEALQRLVAGRTTFAIAHRLSTLSAADRLFIMENGKLVEQGTHAELLAKPDGVYAKLHRTQMELQALIAV